MQLFPYLIYETYFTLLRYLPVFPYYFKSNEQTRLKHASVTSIFYLLFIIWEWYFKYICQEYNEMSLNVRSLLHSLRFFYTLYDTKGLFDCNNVL